MGVTTVFYSPCNLFLRPHIQAEAHQMQMNTPSFFFFVSNTNFIIGRARKNNAFYRKNVIGSQEFSGR